MGFLIIAVNLTDRNVIFQTSLRTICKTNSILVQILSVVMLISAFWILLYTFVALILIQGRTLYEVHRHVEIK